MNNSSNSFWVALQQARRNRMGLETSQEEDLPNNFMGPSSYQRFPVLGSWCFPAVSTTDTWLRLHGSDSETFLSTMKRSYCACPPFLKREQRIQNDSSASSSLAQARASEEPFGHHGPGLATAGLENIDPHTVDPSLSESSSLTSMHPSSLLNTHLNKQ